MKDRLKRPVGLKPALPLLLALVAIRFAVGGGMLSESDPAATGVDRLAYAQFMAYRVADPYDLESFFTDQQDFFLPINPPYADFTLNQPGFPSAIPFDPSSFPPDFTKNLLPRLENSVPVYGVWIEEDPVTRDTVFRNEQDQVIYRIPPPPGYDPYVYIKALKPDLYSGRYPSLQLQSLLAIFDPARIRIHVTLVPEKHVEPYLFVADLLARQPPENSPMLLMGEGSGDFAFVAMKPTNSIAFTIALPDMTNDIDIFTGNDLSAAWSFAARDLPHPGTNLLHWIDSNDWLEVGYPVRYYAAGDAGSDHDGDGFADAREVMVYQTDPTNASSRPFTVSGAVDYPGAETGPVHVVFVTAPESWSTAKSTLLPAPGGYTNHEIGNAQATWIKAFVDLDGGHRFDVWEPWGLYDITALLVTQDLSDIDISMADVRSVWGRIDYTGTATGDIHVLVVDDRESWDNTYESILPWNLGATSPTGAPIYLSFPADYRVVDFPAGEYYIKAFMDVDGDGLFSLVDVPGHVSANALGVYSRTTGLDITLSEDGDGDGLPDAWEWWYLGHTMSGSGDDPDGDRLTSAEELSLGTSPGVSNIVVDMSAATLVGKGKEVQRYKVGYPEFTSQAVTGSVPPKRYLDMIRQMEIQDYYQDNYCGTPQTSYQITHDKMCRYAYSPENYAQAWVEFSGTLSWHSEQEGPNCTYTSNGNGSYSTSNWPGTQCWEDYICTSPPRTTNDCCEYQPPREFPLIGGTSVTVQSTISQRYVSHDPLSTNSWISSTCTVSVITEYFLSITENLSDEYTTDEVESDARADLAALGSIDSLAWYRMLYRYPPEEVVEMWYATNKSAEFSMDADELNVTLRDFEYHWSFPTETGVVYRLEWQELFIPADTNTPASISTQRTFSCIGNGQTNTTPSYYINAPASRGAVWPIVLKVEIVPAKSQACDGEQVDIDLVVTPSSAKSYLSAVQFTATKPGGGTQFDNPSGQGITISQRGSDITEWSIDNVRWYATQADHCNATADYEIKASYSIGGSQCETAPATFTVDTTFGTCLSGLAWVTQLWSGNIQIATVQLTNGQWEATISQNTFSRNVQASSTWTAPANSQYHDMVRDEEQFHEGQYEGTTSTIVNDLWDAQLVMNAATAYQPFTGYTEASARAAAQADFDAARSQEESRSLALDSARTCDMEREAKTAAGASYRAAMPCTYPNCP